MVSWPDPHHPFNPPGKFWDMYRPEDMAVPPASLANDRNPPEYVKIAERDRARDKSMGQRSGSLKQGKSPGRPAITSGCYS